MSDSLGLVEVIKKLRKDITAAVRAGEGHKIRFEVNAIDVELQTVVKKTAKGGVKFEVLGVGANGDANYEHAVTHKIKLSITPVNEKDIDPETGESSNIKLADNE